MGCLQSQPQDPLGRPGGIQQGKSSSPSVLDTGQSLQGAAQGSDHASASISDHGPPVAIQKQVGSSSKLAQRLSSEASSTAAVIAPARSGQQPPLKEEPDPGGTEERPGYERDPDSTISPLRSHQVALPPPDGLAAAGAAPKPAGVPAGIAQNVQRLHALLLESNAQLLGVTPDAMTATNMLTNAGPASIGAGKVQSANILVERSYGRIEPVSGEALGSQQFYESCESQVDRIAAKLAQRAQRGVKSAGPGLATGAGGPSGRMSYDACGGGGPGTRTAAAVAAAGPGSQVDQIPSLASQLPTSSNYMPPGMYMGHGGTASSGGYGAAGAAASAHNTRASAASAAAAAAATAATLALAAARAGRGVDGALKPGSGKGADGFVRPGSSGAGYGAPGTAAPSVATTSLGAPTNPSTTTGRGSSSSREHRPLIIAETLPELSEC